MIGGSGSQSRRRRCLPWQLLMAVALLLTIGPWSASLWSEESDSVRHVTPHPDDIMRLYYSDFAVDTTGPEPTIRVWIATTGDYSQLDSMGIYTLSRFQDVVRTTIPISMMADIGALPTVLWVAPSVRVPPSAPAVDLGSRRVRDSVDKWYSDFAVDTTGPEPLVDVWIYTTGDNSELDSMGISGATEYPDNIVFTTVTIRLLPDIKNLASVLHVFPAMRANSLQDTGPPGHRDSFDIEAFVDFNYNRWAIDTSGIEPYISVMIYTDGDYSELEALGISTKVRIGETVLAGIPVREIPTVSRLRSVIHVTFSPRIYYHADYGLRSDRNWMGHVRGSIVPHPSWKGFSALILLTRVGQRYMPDASDLVDQGLNRVTLTHELCSFSFDSLRPGYYSLSVHLEANGTGKPRGIIHESVDSIKSDSPVVIVDSIRVRPDKVSAVTIDLPQLAEPVPDSGRRLPVIRSVWQELYEPF